MKKHFAAACLLGTALVAAPALAQDMSTSSNATSASQAANAPGASGGQFLTQMETAQWRGSKLVGVDVFGSDDSKIGDINEVIVDRNGQARAIVIGVGGFLGIGEKNVAIPWDKVQWMAAGSGSMASGASAGGAPASDRATPRDIAQTTTGAPADASAQPAAGGATLSTAPGDAPMSGAAAPGVTAAPGATSAPATSATSSATGPQDYPDRAVVSMSKQDLQNAPEFKYASQAASTGSGPSSSSGSAR